MSYAERLRAVGQALETLHVRNLDLIMEGEDFVVTGKLPSQQICGEPDKRFRFETLSRVWSRLRRRVELQPALPLVKIRYTPGDLGQLEREGRARRRDPNGTPDPYSLSQALRGAGFYLDHKGGSRLVAVSVRDRWVTLRYRLFDGDDREEIHGTDILYNFWVKMYLQRKRRVAM